MRTDIARLRLWVDPSVPGLRDMYREHVKQHNEHVRTAVFPNSGFDLLIARDTEVPPGLATTHMAKLAIKAEMWTEVDQQATAYYLMPRSSLSKTPLMQSNHIGLIDAGYRGEIMVPMRNASNDTYRITKHTRLFQLCHPLTLPIFVEWVEDEIMLSSTERGEGGFGSTGTSGAFVAGVR